MTDKQLPAPRKDRPVVVFAITDPIEPEKTERVIWAMGQKNPIATEFVVMRMFFEDEELQIYSMSQDRSNGIRNIIPGNFLRLTQEVMSLDVFLDELELAENGDDDEDDLEPDPESQQTPATNGQPSAASS